MNKKTTDIVSYLTIVGWLFAYFAGDRIASRKHINQSLNIAILTFVYGIAQRILGRLWILGTLVNLIGVIIFALWCVSLYSAVTEKDIHIPFISDICLL